MNQQTYLVSHETGDAFAGARRGVHETRDTFAGGKWPEFGCFVRAEVSAVSGEAVGGWFEAAVDPNGAKTFAMLAKKAVFGVFCACWASFIPLGR